MPLRRSNIALPGVLHRMSLHPSVVRQRVPPDCSLSAVRSVPFVQLAKQNVCPNLLVFAVSLSHSISRCQCSSVRVQFRQSCSLCSSHSARFTRRRRTRLTSFVFVCVHRPASICTMHLTPIERGHFRCNCNQFE